MNTFDGTVNHGRKGIAYDWRSLCAPIENSVVDTGQIDAELARLIDRLTVPDRRCG